MKKLFHILCFLYMGFSSTYFAYLIYLIGGAAIRAPISSLHSNFWFSMFFFSAAAIACMSVLGWNMKRLNQLDKEL